MITKSDTQRTKYHGYVMYMYDMWHSQSPLQICMHTSTHRCISNLLESLDSNSIHKSNWSTVYNHCVDWSGSTGSQNKHSHAYVAFRYDELKCYIVSLIYPGLVLVGSDETLTISLATACWNDSLLLRVTAWLELV